MGEEMLNREIKPADWVDAIITQGINEKASDIHFEPQRDKFVVYYRIDGVLHFVDSMPFGLFGDGNRPFENFSSLRYY
jgi:type II secretory ATPase GspE/PulE/Tfp pilus assembly ATPase PilB-like protein